MLGKGHYTRGHGSAISTKENGTIHYIGGITMRRNSGLIFTVIAVLAIVPFVWAKNTYAVESMKGKGSLAASLSYQHQETSFGDSDSETDTTSLMGSLGYFLSDHLEVNFAPMIMILDPDQGDKYTLYSYFGNLKVNFYQKGWIAVPYVGVQAGVTGYESGDDDDSSFSYGALGGIKLFVTEDVSLNLELNYLHTTFDADDGGDDTDLDVTSFFVGFSWYFGG